MRLHSLFQMWCLGLVGFGIVEPEISAVCAQTPTPEASAPANDDTAAIQKKLTDIVIPRLEFHDATLPDAIEKWRQESRRLDPDPDRARRGINLFLKMPPGAAPSSPVRINLTLKNISVLDALRYIALQAGLEMKIEPWAVSLTPAHNLAKPITVAESPTPTPILSSPTPP